MFIVEITYVLSSVIDCLLIDLIWIVLDLGLLF